MVPDLEKPRLSESEKAMLIRELEQTVAHFEFGRADRRCWLFVQAFSKWFPLIRTLHGWLASRNTRRSHRVVLTVSALSADIGPVGDWGTPADRNSLSMRNAYLEVGWAEMGATENPARPSVR